MFFMHHTVAAKELVDGGAANVIDRMELLVTSGTVYGGYRSNKNKNEECGSTAKAVGMLIL